MAMLNILHGADFHLDSPFAALPPEQAVERRREQRELLDRLAQLARERRADLVLLSGDLFDSEKTYYETAQALARTLGQIRAPVFLAPGNHDWYSSRSPYASIRWPDNVHIFRSPEIERVELPDLGCVVYGGAFSAPNWEGSLLEGFQPEEDSGLLRLMVLHGDVDGTGGYNDVTEEELAASGMDYVALGHVHVCSGLKRAGEVCYAYPGCPEGRGFDELGEKGVLWVTAQRGNVEAEFVPLAKRQYHILDVDVTGREPEEALAEAAERLHPEHIYRIRLTGEAELGAVQLDRLTEQVEGKCYSVTLRDRTTVRRDLWARRGEDSLTGLFLSQLARQMDGTEGEERQVLERAVRFGLAALEGGEDR
jgi:DNA repair exonuclease SbcCD nuclease subunit